jgi:hypothetical protein
MRDIFACHQCHSIYEITRRAERPLMTPFCRVCGNKFPPSELSDWLVYVRAEPEWTAEEWLRGLTQVQEDTGQAEFATGNIATEHERIDTTARQSVPPSRRLQKLASFGRTRE